MDMHATGPTVMQRWHGRRAEQALDDRRLGVHCESLVARPISRTVSQPIRQLIRYVVRSYNTASNWSDLYEYMPEIGGHGRLHLVRCPTRVGPESGRRFFPSNTRSGS